MANTYTQVTAPIMSTVSRPGWCAEFQYNAFGGRNGWGFGSARAAWNGQANRHVGEAPPAGVAVPIWFSWSADPDWHAAISLADGRLLMSPMTGKTVGQSIYSSMAAFLRAFPGMTYLGWSESMDGTTVVTPSKSTPSPGGTDVATPYHLEDARAKQGKRVQQPGEGFYLHTDPAKGVSNYSNVIGRDGQYILTQHVYMEGEPGDEIIATYIWQTDPAGKSPVDSEHYAKTYVIPESGVLYDHATFIQYAGGAKPQWVRLQAIAPKRNKGPVKITRFDSDALCLS